MKYLKSTSKESDRINYILLDVGSIFNFYKCSEDYYRVGIFAAGQYIWMFNNDPINVNPDKFMMVICEIPDRKIVDVNEVLKTAGEL